MTIWEWIQDFEIRAVAARDRARLRLARAHSEAYRHRQTDPDRMLQILLDGRRQAEALGEPWWVLFFDHWRLETLIYYKDDYRDVIELGVRATLELRKPVYDNFPLRFGIYCNLIAAYLCVDPRGYADSIRAAIDYLLAQAPPDGSDRYLLQARRHWFACEIGDLEEAQRLAVQELAMCDADSDRQVARHHEADTYKALCWIGYRRSDWDALARWAEAGSQVAQQIGYRYEQSLFLLWRALLARRAGSAEARSLFRQGLAIMGRLGQAPGQSFFDAQAAYYEHGGELEAAWQVRQRELDTTLGRGQLSSEALTRLKRLRLLKGLDRPTADEERLAREAIARLRRPEWYLGELERVLAGRPSPDDQRI